MFVLETIDQKYARGAVVKPTLKLNLIEITASQAN